MYTLRVLIQVTSSRNPNVCQNPMAFGRESRSYCFKYFTQLIICPCMAEGNLRVFLVISASVILSGFASWGLGKILPKFGWRDALVTGLCIYFGLTLDAVLLK
jgi:hypothetical protein